MGSAIESAPVPRWLTKLEGWAQRKRNAYLLARYGGIQFCPWCRQCAQSGPHDWHFKPWADNSTLDVLTCSVCGGTSVWLFGLGMIYMRELDPPAPEFPRRIDAPNPTPDPNTPHTKGTTDVQPS